MDPSAPSLTGPDSIFVSENPVFPLFSWSQQRGDRHEDPYNLYFIIYTYFFRLKWFSSFGKRGENKRTTPYIQPYEGEERRHYITYAQHNKLN